MRAAIEAFWEEMLICAEDTCRLALEQLEAKLFGGGMLTYAGVCWRMLTYSDVC